MQRSGAVLTVARWSARHPWRAMAGWVAFVVLCLVIGSAVGSNEISNADDGSGQSGKADRTVAAAGYADPIVEQVLIQPAAGTSPAVLNAAATELATELRTVPVVDDVDRPQLSADGESALLSVRLAVDGETGDAALALATDRVPDLQAAVSSYASAHPELVVGEVGDASIETSLGKQLDDDFAKAELLSLPATLVVLLVTFGALLAAGVPVLLAITAVAAAIGLSQLTSHVVPNSDIISSVILLIGMAVGVDYSLFYLRREREERAKGRTSRQAVEIAAATSGRAIVVSGVAVIIAMSGLFLSGDPTFTSLGVGTVLVVAVAMLGSVTVLPAILVKLGRAVDRPRVPFIHRLRRQDGQGRFWPAVLRVVLHRPVLSFVVGAGLLVAMALPAIGMVLRFTGPQDLPRSIPEVATYERIADAFPVEGSAHEVVVWTTDGSPLDRDAVTEAASRVEAAAEAQPELFAASEAQPEFNPRGDVATFEIAVPYDSGDSRAPDSLAALRDTAVPQALAGMDGVEWGVAGEIAGDVDFRDLLSQRLPLIMGFVLLLTFVVLVLAFRSVVVAGTAIVLNALSVAAAYGLLVIVFQHHWAEGLLGFHSNGAVLSWLPLFLFVVLFGLSMDYHVFVVSRVREAAMRGMPIRAAVADGVTRSAGVVTSAAAVMIAVFAIFATLSMLDFKQMGVGLAAAILIDATIVRAVLLPAAMTLLGDWNWYLPSWLQWLPHLETEVHEGEVIDLAGEVPPLPAPGPGSHVVEPVG